jgi:hypothetical protein
MLKKLDWKEQILDDENTNLDGREDDGRKRVTFRVLLELNDGKKKNLAIEFTYQ